MNFRRPGSERYPDMLWQDVCVVDRLVPFVLRLQHCCSAMLSILLVHANWGQFHLQQWNLTTFEPRRLDRNRVVGSLPSGLGQPCEGILHQQPGLVPFKTGNGWTPDFYGSAAGWAWSWLMDGRSRQRTSIKRTRATWELLVHPISWREVQFVIKPETHTW